MLDVGLALSARVVRVRGASRDIVREPGRTFSSPTLKRSIYYLEKETRLEVSRVLQTSRKLKLRFAGIKLKRFWVQIEFLASPATLREREHYVRKIATRIYFLL